MRPETLFRLGSEGMSTPPCDIRKEREDCINSRDFARVSAGECGQSSGGRLNESNSSRIVNCPAYYTTYLKPCHPDFLLWEPVFFPQNGNAILLSIFAQ